MSVMSCQFSENESSFLAFVRIVLTTKSITTTRNKTTTHSFYSNSNVFTYYQPIYLLAIQIQVVLRRYPIVYPKVLK